MFKRISTIAAIAIAAISITACSGGTGSSTIPNPVQTPVTKQGAAQGTITMSIPLGNGSNQRGTMSVRRPMFVDGNTNGNVTIVFDGVNIPISFAPTVTSGAGPSQSNISLPNGGTFSYTSTVGPVPTNGNQIVATLNATYTTIPGPHTVGVVQTNGACGSDPCILNTDGYVLAEGEATPDLAPGPNANTVLYLKGVLESDYICPHSGGCSSLGSPNTDGSYTLDVIVADENGTAIPYQKDAQSNPIPFDNGSYSIVAVDPSIVTITPLHAGPYTTPGTDRASGTYGEEINVKCANVGSTVIEAKLDAGDNSAPTVTKFNAVSGDYPAAGSVLGSVGADLYYGNTPTINCTSTGSMTIQ